MLLWLTLAVILFELWYAAAFLVASIRMNESRLLLLVGQGVMIMLSFGYIGYIAIGGMPLNLIIALAPLLIAMIALGVWRSFAPRIPRFAQSYPRGFIDVLLFRRPRLADLKRRVRTK